MPGTTETVLSMGLDVGTTTTILVLTRLELKNLGSITAVPRIEIVSKEVIYAGQVHMTPFSGEESIDEDALTALVLAEYEKAGVSPGDVQSGAIIITGQAALKSNAQVLLHRLAANAGRFVVATAGPELEAVIAGRGSGAASRSRRFGYSVANLDIGGGTTNIAVFSGGDPVDALAVNVGGRLIRVNPRTKMIEHISAPGAEVLASLGLDLREGQAVRLEDLRAVAARLARVLEEVMSGSLSPLGARLMIGDARGLRREVEGICFSGGVGSLLYAGGAASATATAAAGAGSGAAAGAGSGAAAGGISTIDDAVRFGDFGPLLAEEIRKTALWKSPKVFQPDQTIYATVIGAGAHLTELSGSTIYLSDPGALPLRNIPVARLPGSAVPASAAEAADAIRQALRVIGGPSGGDPVALALGIPRLDFEEVQRLATAIAEVFGGRGGAPAASAAPSGSPPIVVVSGGDYGKVLGQSLRTMLNHGGPTRTIVCIDQVRVESGDYIDIGEPLYSGAVVPVVVKTLVFSGD